MYKKACKNQDILYNPYNMPKSSIILVSAIFLGLGFCFVANADSGNLSGYVYSQDVGWVSLSCVNTSSCGTVNYGVATGSNGSLSGYGFSQNGEWVNFNPNFGGVGVKQDGSLSGWIFAEKTGWARIDGVKVVSLNDLQSEVVLAEDTINSNNLSTDSTMSLLNSLCGKFLTSSECDAIND